MKTLVLGLGNPILSDDGVGIRVARELEGRLDGETTIMETSLAGLDMLDLMAGYDRAVLIDAIQTGEGRAGCIYTLEPGELSSTRHASSPHDINLATALELGNKLGLDLPERIDIFAIEVSETSRFSEECTPEVEASIPACAQLIIRELEGDGHA